MGNKCACRSSTCHLHKPSSSQDSLIEKLYVHGFFSFSSVMGAIIHTAAVMTNPFLKHTSLGCIFQTYFEFLLHLSNCCKIRYGTGLCVGWMYKQYSNIRINITMIGSSPYSVYCCTGISNRYSASYV